MNWVELATVHGETRFVIVLLASAAAKNIYTVRLVKQYHQKCLVIQTER
ncbi:MAG: hypothetical protein WAZ77_00450 [Candidatus Nitrosopolaris sp.]